MKTFTSPKGTVLPLQSIKGKDYLGVAQRIQWFVEENPSFTIDTQLLSVSKEETLARAEIKVLNPEGRVLRSATATKRETLQGFSDHTEKAETSAIGRALAMLGYGTQFTAAELEEGTRLADAPAEPVKLAAVSNKTSPVVATGGMFDGWDD